MVFGEVQGRNGNPKMLQDILDRKHYGENSNNGTGIQACMQLITWFCYIKIDAG